MVKRDLVLNAVAFHPMISAAKRLIIGNASECKLDAKDRIYLPKEFRSFAGFEGAIRIVGRGNSLHLFAPIRWEKLLEEVKRDPYHRIWNERDWTPLSSLERRLHAAAQSRDYRSFERLVAEGFSALDATIVDLTQFSKDDGIDAIVHALNRQTGQCTTNYIQCKAGRRKVVVSEIRELIGVIGRDGADTGILVAANGLTRASEKEALLSKIKVRTFDVRTFIEFLVRYGCT